MEPTDINTISVVLNTLDKYKGKKSLFLIYGISQVFLIWRADTVCKRYYKIS